MHVGEVDEHSVHSEFCHFIPLRPKDPDHVSIYNMLFRDVKGSDFRLQNQETWIVDETHPRFQFVAAHRVLCPVDLSNAGRSV